MLSRDGWREDDRRSASTACWLDDKNSRYFCSSGTHRFPPPPPRSSRTLRKTRPSSSKRFCQRDSSRSTQPCRRSPPPPPPPSRRFRRGSTRSWASFDAKSWLTWAFHSHYSCRIRPSAPSPSPPPPRKSSTRPRATPHSRSPLASHSSTTTARRSSVRVSDPPTPPCRQWRSTNTTATRRSFCTRST